MGFHCTLISVLFGALAFSFSVQGHATKQANINIPTMNVAVASNFLTTAKQLESAFEKNTEYSLNIIGASTGQLTHQILNGAPFDVFLAANKQHPASIRAQFNLPVDDLFQYAQGALVLVSHNPINNIPSLPEVLSAPKQAYSKIEAYIIKLVLNSANKITIANENLAPYGRASFEVLRSLNLIDHVKNKLITGQNIAQTHQFFASGSVDVAFIARSQLKGLTSNSNIAAIKGIIPISRQLHTPIEQWGLLLNDTDASQAFIQFLSLPLARDIIQRNGYDIVNNSPPSSIQNN